MKRYEILKPDCYRHFSCKGGSCRYSCCGEWRITMSKEEYRQIRKKGVELDSELIRLIEPEKRTKNLYYEIVLDEDKKCPFLTEDRLCNLQCQFGPDILSETCKVFPRIYHKYLDKLEGGLSLGCERVLEILLEEKKLTFSNYVESIPSSHNFNSVIDFNLRKKYPELIYYYDIQSLCLSILQAEDASMEDRLILLGIAIHHISNMVKKGEEKDIPAYITHFLSSIDGMDAASKLQKMEGEHVGVFLHNLLMLQMNQLEDANHYKELVNKIGRKLKADVQKKLNTDGFNTSGTNIQYSAQAYQDSQENFRRFMVGKENFLENVMVGFMFHYNVPFIKAGNGIWKDYTYMAWVYSMLKFILTMALDEDSTEEDMIDYTAILFRNLGHNKGLYQNIIDSFEKNDSSTLAHMAVLLKS